MKKLIVAAIVCIILAKFIGERWEYGFGAPWGKESLNEEKWKSANISHYRFSLTIACFCDFYLSRMPLTVEVQDGKVISMKDSNGVIVTNGDQDFSHFSNMATMEDLFKTVKQAMSQNPDEISIFYDSTYGFPVSFSVDQDKTTADDEWQMYISGFQILP